MIATLLSAKRRTINTAETPFVTPQTDEIALAMTGHLEEVFVGHDAAGFRQFDLREIRRFAIIRRPAGMPYRVVCRRDGRPGPVELTWQLRDDDRPFITSALVPA